MRLYALSQKNIADLQERGFLSDQNGRYFEHSAEVFDTPLYNIANAVNEKEMLSETQKQIYNDAVERFTKMNPAKQNVVLEHIKHLFRRLLQSAIYHIWIATVLFESMNTI